MVENILWDLDGTLLDPKHGIIRCFQYALEKSGLHVPQEQELLWIIGPPLTQSYSALLPNATESEVLSLVHKYRERFAEIGIYENEIYPEVMDLLRALKNKKHFVATSKPHVYAEKMIKHYEFSPHFQHVYGSELSGVRSDKGDLIKYILDKENIAPHSTAMIGDRKYDMIGAKKAGILAIGITWGYGSKEELLDAGADHVFDSPKKLEQFFKQKENV